MKKMLKYGLVLGMSAALITSPLIPSVNAVEKQSNFLGQEKQVTENTTYEKNKLVIKTTKALTTKELKNLGATVSQRIPDLNYFVLKFNSNKNWKNAVEKLATNTSIQKISLSPIYSQLATGDPKASKQYLHTLLNSKESQKLIGKNKIKVAVIDGGVSTTSPDLKAQVTQAKNMVNPMHASNNSSHGTHVAGIIGATKNNGVGGYGVNPTAQILGYDVFDGKEGAYDYIIAKAIIQAAKDGAKVINMSLGSAYSSDIMADAISYAHSKGVAIVAAAGNEGTSDKQYPASYEGVISVGSVNAQKKLSVFSSYGVSTDLVAPGEDIYSTSYQKRGSSFEKMSGTSMASPVVAGVASLILSKSPKLTPVQLEYILEKTATDLGTKGFDEKYGNGLVNPVAALKFDPKKIPSLTSKKWTDSAIQYDAKNMNMDDEITSSLTKPAEQKWVRTKVTKGDKIQLQAKGDAFADLKVAVNFYGKNASQKLTFNDGIENEVEAPYFEVPFDGVMAIGISDINGLVSTSPYSLSVESGEFSEDESSREKVMPIKSVNMKVADQYFQPIEGGDEDVLHFKATKNELVEIQLSAIPGVKTAIQLFDKSGFSDEPLENESDEESKLDEDDYEESSEPLAISNNSKANAINSLAFETKAGEEYYMVLSNTPTEDISFEMLLQMLLSGQELSSLEPTPKNSLIPYAVSLKSKSIPADEDKLASDNLVEIKSQESSITVNQATKTKLNSKIASEDDSDFPDDESGDFEDMQDQYLQQGRPFNFNGETKAYLNGSEDIDGYYFTTTSSAVHQLAIKTKNKKDVPYVSLYEVNYFTNEDGDEEKSIEPITDNYEEFLADGTSMKMPLKAKTTYLLEVSDQLNERLAFDGYSLKSTLLKNSSADRYEMNNTITTATKFPTTGLVEANFASIDDVDHYYYSAKTTGIYSIDYQMKKLTTTDKKNIPSSLRNRYISAVSIVQDKNNNKRLDENESNLGLDFIDVQNDLSLHGSIEMKKGENFFIVVQPQQFEYFNFSISPYQLALKVASTKDEDAKNIVKKNTPSKAIAISKKTSKIYEKSAYLNPGQKTGDSDWFVHNVKTNGKLSATLTIPSDLDGVLEIYKNGKKLAKADYYGDGDTEKVSLKVTKGKYYFKVNDRLKRASVHPYKLTINR